MTKCSPLSGHSGIPMKNRDILNVVMVQIQKKTIVAVGRHQTS